ncbi:MAG: DNA repair protein RadA [Oscillospiraceae bacterium]|nr:DNA repair protein RadA [Oscillospiraceae bacterium]
MSAKVQTIYICDECGLETPRWQGKCPGCGNWNTLVENQRQEKPKAGIGATKSLLPATKLSRLNELDAGLEIRRDTGLGEMNRVLGGGAVDGSVCLLSGDPGIGKSTLLLQMCKTLCKNQTVLYIAGEESPRQIKLRAERLGLEGERLIIAPETDIEQVIACVEQTSPDLVIVDSIQTINCAGVSSSAGSVSQVRECTGFLIRMAKEREIPVFVVGHVNKDGGIAGPKVLEHMVDVVLYFEGERHSSYRILRAVKNRYGSTNEIGVFEMTDGGLSDVENPSLTLLSGRPKNVSGTCVACVMEGTRPILAEVQALVGKTGFGTPRRMSTGFDLNRAALLIAVLEKRGGFFFGNLDAYLNIVGGLKLEEPGADLPVVLALLSNLLDKPVPENLAAFGEVGLAGEVRAAAGARQRVSECVRLGFHKLVLPKASLNTAGEQPNDVELIPLTNISDAMRIFR